MHVTDIKKINLFLETLVDMSDVSVINQQLAQMLVIINGILIEIEKSKNIEDANYYFDILQKIHDTLDILIFHKNIPISIVELQRFASDCERLDDNWQRNYLYQKIKSRQYSLANYKRL